jgi:hypothetical protein
VHQMVSEGRISEEEAQTHPQRSIVTRALGVERDVDVDERDLEAEEGDRLLLCSDGLTSMMRDESVAEILATHADPQEAADALVDAANRAGGLDNITVIVIDFEQGDGVEFLGPAPARGEESGSGVVEVAGTSRGAPPPTRSEQLEPASDLSTPRRAEARRGPRWRRPLLWVGVVIVIVLAGFVALRIYANHQWYVGVDHGDVAVYQGIPTTILGLHLSHPVRVTGLRAGEAEKLAPYRRLSSGITAGSETDANSIVAQMRRDIVARRRATQRTKKSGGTG